MREPATDMAVTQMDSSVVSAEESFCVHGFASTAGVSAANGLPADQTASQETYVENVGVLLSLQSFCTIITIAIFIITFIVQPFRIPSESMEQTLLVGDFLLVNKQVLEPAGELGRWLLPYTPVKRGDIVVFHYPVDSSLHLVKRVIGVPGDHLHLKNGLVFINGKPLHEPYAMYVPSRPDSFRDNFPLMPAADPGVDTRWWLGMHRYVRNGDLVVPPGEYFVMGDNRNDSEDSRYWGFVPLANIVGQPWIVYFSLRHVGAIAGLPDAEAQQHAGSLGFLVDSLDNLARWDRSFHIIR
ncbi:MAG: signal peptidase I [Acidobacteriaceae bacterium]